jgi:hypothetical protein
MPAICSSLSYIMHILKGVSFVWVLMKALQQQGESLAPCNVVVEVSCRHGIIRASLEQPAAVEPSSRKYTATALHPAFTPRSSQLPADLESSIYTNISTCMWRYDNTTIAAAALLPQLTCLNHSHPQAGIHTIPLHHPFLGLNG